MNKAEQIAHARELLAESVRYLPTNAEVAFMFLSDAKGVMASKIPPDDPADFPRLMANLRDGWECRQVDPSVYIGAVAIARHKLLEFRGRIEKETA